MSAHIELSNKQVTEIISEHIENFSSSEDAEKFLLFVAKRICVFDNIDLTRIKATVDKHFAINNSEDADV